MSIVPPAPLFPDELALRQCRKCGQGKPLTEFPARPGAPDGRKTICCLCDNARQRGRWRAQRDAAGISPRVRRSADEPWPCAICGELKALDEFVTHKAKPYGRGYHCRQCDRTLQAKWRAERRARGYKRPPLTEAQREHERWMQRKRVYGITKAEVLTLLAEQKQCCALCLRPLRLDGKRGYFVDHCHATGRIRGILCPLCNGFLARIGDDEAGARRVLAYVLGNAPGSAP